MAGEKSEVVRNDAWITVLATSEQETRRAADVQVVETQRDSNDEQDLPAESLPRSTVPRGWSALSLATFVGGLGALGYGTYVALDRYFPQLSNVRGVDGEPPSVFVQTDEPANIVAEYGGRVVETISSWPYVLAAPIAVAALLGLLTGWLRWRVGLARAAERRARDLEATAARLTAQTSHQASRLQTMDETIAIARGQVHDLTDQLEGQTERVTTDALVGQRLIDDLEAKSLEAHRLAADLEDALIERDGLEAKVADLEAAAHEAAEQRAETADAAERLHAAADLIREQRIKIDSLEQHLDQVRRRTAEMASEARSTEQLRSAWAQAEEVISDLSHQLSQAERGRSSYGAQTAEAIVADNSRVIELEELLNEAADVIELTQEQLRQTRFQLSERDAAIARSDVRNEALGTEIALLNAEIDQAAYTIASLQELPTRQRQTESMLGDLREALKDERGRSADLERQLRIVSARALRLEERLLGTHVESDEVLDLTESVSAPAA